jgi:hypothetical protein
MPCFVSVGLLLASVEGSIDIGITKESIDIGITKESIDIGITKEYLVFLYSYIIILVTCG